MWVYQEPSTYSFLYLIFFLCLSVYHENGNLSNSSKIWLQFYRQFFSWSFCISVLNWIFLSSSHIKHPEIKIRHYHWRVSGVSLSSNQLWHVLGEPYCVPNYTTSTNMPVLFQACWFGSCNFKKEKLFVICYATSW